MPDQKDQEENEGDSTQGGAGSEVEDDSSGGGQQGEGGHKDMSEQPTAAGALWTRSSHPLIRKALSILGINPDKGLILDPNKAEVRKIIEELDKKRKIWVLINNKFLHNNQIFLYMDDKGRVFAEPTATLATDVNMDNPIVQSNPLLDYMPNNQGDQVLISSDRVKWSYFNPLQVSKQGEGGKPEAYATQLIYVPEEIKHKEGARVNYQVGSWFMRREVTATELKKIEFVSGGMNFNLQTYIEALGVDNPLVKYMGGIYFEEEMQSSASKVLTGPFVLMPLVITTPQPVYASAFDEYKTEPILYYEAQAEEQRPSHTFLLLRKLAQPKLSRAEKPAPIPQSAPEIIDSVIRESTASIPELAPVVMSLPAIHEQPKATIESITEQADKAHSVEHTQPSPKIVTVPEPSLTTSNVTEDTEKLEGRNDEVIEQSENTRPVIKREEQSLVLVNPDDINKVFKKAQLNVFENLHSAVQTTNLIRELRAKYGYENVVAVSGDGNLPDDPEQPLVLRIREGKHQNYFAEMTISKGFTAARDKRREATDTLKDKYIIRVKKFESSASQKHLDTAFSDLHELGNQSWDKVRIRAERRRAGPQARSRTVM